MGIHQRFWRAEAEAAAAIAVELPGAAIENWGDGMFVALGPGRYVNRAIGVGPDLDDRDLTAIERFYSSRGLPPSVQVTSWASEETLERLIAQGYRPQSFRAVVATPLPLPDLVARSAHVEIVEVGEHNLDDWLATLADGNEITAPEARVVSDEFARAAHRAAGSTDFIAYVGGEAAGCGSVQIVSGVCVLGGACSRPSYRGQGVQGALIRHRIRLATESGCDLVASNPVPGGTSARNLQRHGLRLIDTQLVLTVA